MLSELAFHVISTRHFPELHELLEGNRPDALPASASLPDSRRLYFGSEFCAHLLPSSTELDAALRFADEHHLPLTLVTPYGGDDFLDKIGKLVEILPAGTEVVANDWGSLRMLAKDGRTVPILGRMLSKLMRDPWVHREWATAREDPGRGSAGGEVGAPRPTARLPELLMESLGVRRAETDALPGGRFAPLEAGGHDVSVYLPWSPLGSGRVCFAGSFGLGPSPRFGVMEECARPCRHVHVELKAGPSGGADDVDEADETLLAGNTMIYRHPAPAVAAAITALPDYVTRVVWEPWIPA